MLEKGMVFIDKSLLLRGQVRPLQNVKKGVKI